MSNSLRKRALSFRPSRFICEDNRRRTFLRRRSLERSLEGNRVPRNYRRRNRFRNSLPECARWNVDSSCALHSFADFPLVIVRVGNSVYLALGSYVYLFIYLFVNAQNVARLDEDQAQWILLHLRLASFTYNHQSVGSVIRRDFVATRGTRVYIDSWKLKSFREKCPSGSNY